MANLRLHSLNDVKLVGRLTRDPELRYTPQGTPVCHFRIAVGRKFKDRNSNERRKSVASGPTSIWICPRAISASA
jgi:single-strand DNA-binding protein